jgi:transcriptional regulator with GAF, ATPase, and Fis domain
MAILLIDEAHQSIFIHRIYGDALSRETFDVFPDFNVSLNNENSINAYIITNNEPVYLIGLDDKTDLLPGYRRILELNPFTSGLFLPLEVRHQVIGAINFFRMTKNLNLTEKDIDKIQNYVSHLANAINNARLAEETQKALLKSKNNEQEISHINQVLQTVNSTLDLDTVVADVTKGLQTIFSFDQIGILLIDEPKETISFTKAYGEGLTDEQIEKAKRIVFPLKKNQSALCDAVLENKSYYFQDITNERITRFSPLDRQILGITQLKSCLIYPIEFQKNIIGVIAFGNSLESFKLSEFDIDKIRRYVTHISTAINNARLFKELETAKETAEKATKAKSSF